MASPSVARRTSRSAVETDDVVMLRAAELAAWARKNTQAVIIAAVLVVGTLGAVIYYRMYSAQRAQRAAAAFLNVQATMGSDTAAATRQLETFANNYDGTVEGAEARIMAAQIWLAKGDANKAVAAVRPAAEGGTVVKEQARMVLASALAAGGKRAEAVDAYLSVAKGTRLPQAGRARPGRRAARAGRRLEGRRGAVPAGHRDHRGGHLGPRHPGAPPLRGAGARRARRLGPDAEVTPSVPLHLPGPRERA
jgi:predicted negative regulator of RcsB-dependent stress response